VGLKGGVCYFLWDRDNPGLCRVTTHHKDDAPSTATRPLREEGVDVFIRFNEGLSILKKVVAVETGQSHSLALPESKRFDRLVSSRKPFGLETTFKGKASKSRGDLLVYQNGGTGHVARSSISSGMQFIDKWKLFAGYAAPGTGNKDTYPHRIISTPFIGEPGEISSETNGTKLSRIRLAQQAFAKDVAWLVHQVVRFGSALLHPRLQPARSMGIDAQVQ
jgi:site-specific DNA-methyltransferase (adenine-specific)